MSAHDAHELFEDLIFQAGFGSLDDDELARLIEHRESGCEECLSLDRLIDTILRGTIAPLTPSAVIEDTTKAIARDDTGSRSLATFEKIIGTTIASLTPSQAATDAIKAQVRASITGTQLEPAHVPTTVASAGAPLVGRSQELARLTGLVDDLRKGEGAFVSVTADAGVGKSRLIRELAEYAADANLEVLVGHCNPDGRTRGYAAFVEILTELAGIPDECSENAKVERLEKFVSDLVGARSDDVFPAVTRLMGMNGGPRTDELLRGLNGQALEHRIHESTRHLLRQRLGQTPLVVVLEDLHWADDATAELVEAVMPLVEMNALLLVAVSRTVSHSAIERVAAFADDNLRLRHHRLSLEPLDQRESLVLARSLIGSDELPESLSRLIADKAGGNPFYIEELLRSYRDAGDNASGSVAALMQDSGVDAVIMSRVDQLDANERRLLEIASVIGQRVQLRLLTDLFDGQSSLDDCISKLERMQLLERGDSRETSHRRVARLRTETILTFRHALVRDAVLASISEENRRALHARCATAIERLFSERLHDYYGVLAYQYSQAHRPAEAQRYLILAGEMAASSAASADALHFFREAHATYRELEGPQPDKRTEARLERNIALALLNTGNLTESIEHFNAALRLMGQWVPSSRAALTIRGLIDLLRIVARLYTGRLGRVDRPATDDEQLVFELLYNRCRAQNIADDKRRDVDNLAAIVHVGHLNPKEVDNSTGILAAAGAFFSFAGISFDPSHRLLALADESARSDDNTDQFLYRTMSFVVKHLEGDWSDAHQISDKLLNHGLRYGLFWDADVYLGLSCEQYSYRGEFDLASRQLEHLEALCDSWGYGFARSNLYAETAIQLLSQRRLDDALAAEQRWYDLRNEESLHFMALGLRARTQVAAGRSDDAENTLLAADQLLTRSGARMFPYYAGFAHTARLALAVVRVEALAEGVGQMDPSIARHARSISRKALRNARSCARDRGDSMRLDARLEWALGNEDGAVTRWIQARTECERLGALPDLARTLADMSVALGGKDGVEDEWKQKVGLTSAECRSKAKEIFERLGCRWDLEQMDADVRRKLRAA